MNKINEILNGNPEAIADLVMILVAVGIGGFFLYKNRKKKQDSK